MIECIRTNSDNPDFIGLYHELDQYLWQKYPTEGQQYWQNNIIEYNPNVLVLYENQQPVACGCFKKYNSNTMEIKRMYVRPEARGKGLAVTILDALENWGVSLGFEYAVLETLHKQLAAIQLYQKMGFQITENYEPYVGNALSVCMKKQIM
ncbi:GNAT family N-acetyltransferase [Flavobacterium branchiophilum]|uniref:GNAT family N-acetyltransferase n=1 Tax=Flavobacterium branchiophilum TaxID=55197 RepID=A0A2H3KCF4_9FLAO|nr:GNAT family N-acetyltransferase [Flavobacterium branchiophilum]PDS25056.1 GNAT family N-acetyltransferase [Flavobacterium branchiophilum]